MKDKGIEQRRQEEELNMKLHPCPSNTGFIYRALKSGDPVSQVEPGWETP